MGPRKLLIGLAIDFRLAGAGGQQQRGANGKSGFIHRATLGRLWGVRHCDVRDRRISRPLLRSTNDRS